MFKLAPASSGGPPSHSRPVVFAPFLSLRTRASDLRREAGTLHPAYVSGRESVMRLFFFFFYPPTRERTGRVLQLLRLQAPPQQRAALLLLLAAPPAVGGRLHAGLPGHAAPPRLPAPPPHPLHPQPLPAAPADAVRRLLLRPAAAPRPLPGPAAGGGRHAVPPLQEPAAPVLQSHDGRRPGGEPAVAAQVSQ